MLSQNQPASSQPQQPSTSNIQPQTSFINDEFLHNPITFKLNLRGQKGGASITQTVSETKAGKHLQNQTEFWFTINESRSLLIRIKTGDTLKLHYDNGASTIFQKPINLYAGLSFRRELKHFNWRLGLNHVQNGLNTDNRLKVDNNGKINACFSTRNILSKGNFTLGLLASYDIIKNVLTKNSLLFAYSFNQNTSFFFKTENENFRHKNPSSISHLFHSFTFDAISKYNESTRLGLQLSLQPRKHPLKEAIIVVEKSLDEQILTKFKIKLSTQIELNCLVKLPIPINKQAGNMSFGLKGSNLLNQSRQFTFGSQLQFNV